MNEPYFVCTPNILDLQNELNALLSQGYEIINIFQVGESNDLAQFAVVAKKLYTGPTIDFGDPKQDEGK